MIERRWSARTGPQIGLVIGAIAAFLVTRLWNLDADVPLWALSQYSPIDEFAYAVPAFNLLHYGAWVYQPASWAPLEGLPMNAAQNLVTAIALRILGDDFWGLRASSVVFGLVAFLSILAIVRRTIADTRRVHPVPASLAGLVILVTMALLLVDFSSLLSGRIVEPTVSRLAVASLVIVLIGRGTFLGPDHRSRRSVAFGAVIAATVMFVYVYNLFLVPAASLTLAWWAYRAEGVTGVIRHAAAFVVGAVMVGLLYFVLVYAIYDQSPVDWYRTWIGSFASSTRAAGGSFDKLFSILGANVFRLDPAFLGIFLASLPVFAWTIWRHATAAAIFIGFGLIFFVAQAAFVADYPARKFVAILSFAVPVAAAGVLMLSPFRAWVIAHPVRIVATGVWLGVVVAVTFLESRLQPVPADTARLSTFTAASGIIGAGAIALLAVSRHAAVRRLCALALAAAMLAPSLYADWAFVIRQPTFTYRDAQIEARGAVDGQVTAGGLSIGMQLYNSSRPVLSGYFVGQTRSEYEADVVRLFDEGIATSMFAYVDPQTRGGWEALGFRLIDTYAILLPRGQQLGRYVYAP